MPCLTQLKFLPNLPERNWYNGGNQIWYGVKTQDTRVISNSRAALTASIPVSGSRQTVLPGNLTRTYELAPASGSWLVYSPITRREVLGLDAGPRIP
jgi:hypothetical protein